MEVEEQERIFFNQATSVNAWDRVLMQSGEKVVKLQEELNQLNSDHQRVEYEVDHIEAQQKELNEILNQLEKQLETSSALDGGGGGGSGIYFGADPSESQRRQIMELATNVDIQMKQMGHELSDAIERVNVASGGSVDPVKYFLEFFKFQFLIVLSRSVTVNCYRDLS